jgi:hypothetical protein
MQYPNTLFSNVGLGNVFQPENGRRNQNQFFLNEVKPFSQNPEAFSAT